MRELERPGGNKPRASRLSEAHGEDGDLRPADFSAEERHAMRTPRRRLVPWDEAVEWTFSDQPPTKGPPCP
jgi:hypothetical protein